jgi:putative ABC transport system substrate-binding protein
MRAAQESTRTVPVVGVASDMVATGFVRSLARPGGNVTGVSLTFEVDGKRQDLLMEAVPEARRFAFLTDPTFTPPAQLSTLQNATRARGVEVAVFKAGAPEQIAPMMDEAKGWGLLHLTFLVRHCSPSIAVSSSSGPQPCACPRFMNGPKWRKRVA